MFLKTSMLFIYAETPLHAGSGSGLGSVDLPIQRERSTGYPLIQSSSIKGALRSAAQDGAEKEAIFGHQNAEHAGALAPGDARILLFPVRSLTGVFAWTTSHDLLARFRRDAILAGLYQGENNALPDLPKDQSGNYAWASSTDILVNTKGNQGTAVLEEFAFQAEVDETKTKKWAEWLAKHALPTQPEYKPWVERLETNLLVLPDDAMRDFLLYATEVVTRVRLDATTKTVQKGALWTEEHLPTETLLYAPVYATRLRLDNAKKPTSLADDNNPQAEAANVLKWIANSNNLPARIQLGGDETVGRGMVALRWNGGKV